MGKGIRNTLNANEDCIETEKTISGQVQITDALSAKNISRIRRYIGCNKDRIGVRVLLTKP